MAPNFILNSICFFKESFIYLVHMSLGDEIVSVDCLICGTSLTIPKLNETSKGFY
jgi:hypothetical protein